MTGILLGVGIDWLGIGGLGSVLRLRILRFISAGLSVLRLRLVGAFVRWSVIILGERVVLISFGLAEILLFVCRLGISLGFVIGDLLTILLVIIVIGRVGVVVVVSVGPSCIRVSSLMSF